MAIHALIKAPLRTFNDFAERPPTRAQRVAAVVVAVVVPLALWDKRGAAVGIVALLLWGGVMLHATFRHDESMAWSRRHVVLDTALVMPLAFVALALVTNLSLAICLAIALAVGAVLAPLAVHRRGAHAAA